MALDLQFISSGGAPRSLQDALITSRKFIVVANEAERDALARAGGIPARAVVIITGVPRSYR